MLIRWLLALWLGCVIADLAAGQESLTSEEQQEAKFLQERVDGFFRSLTNKSLGPEPAVRELIGNGPLKDRNEEISKLIEQALSLDQKYGPYTGHESVQTKFLGSDLVFSRYLYKGERFPVVWSFTFYRPGADCGR